MVLTEANCCTICASLTNNIGMHFFIKTRPPAIFLASIKAAQNLTTGRVMSLVLLVEEQQLAKFPKDAKRFLTISWYNSWLDLDKRLVNPEIKFPIT